MQMGKQAFPATARKLNESPELKRLGIEFATIIPYRTAKNAEIIFFIILRMNPKNCIID